VRHLKQGKTKLKIKIKKESQKKMEHDQ